VVEGFESPFIVGRERVHDLATHSAVFTGSWMHSIFLNSVVMSFDIHTLLSSQTFAVA
jgi:hypothetical protein